MFQPCAHSCSTSTRLAGFVQYWTPDYTHFDILINGVLFASYESLPFEVPLVYPIGNRSAVSLLWLPLICLLIPGFVLPCSSLRATRTCTLRLLATLLTSPRDDSKRGGRERSRRGQRDHRRPDPL